MHSTACRCTSSNAAIITNLHFFCEKHYHRYRDWLGEALTGSGCRLHAYALMTKYVHLLVTPRMAEAVPGLVISLGRRYVQYLNTT